jgi:hypothetical protein
MAKPLNKFFGAIDNRLPSGVTHEEAHPRTAIKQIPARLILTNF